MGILDFNSADPIVNRADAIIDDESADEISFWPDQVSDAELHNRRAAEARMMTLFGSRPVVDPIKHFESERALAPLKPVTPRPFQLVPSQFMAKARRNRPREALATASGFAAWIYSLYGSAYGDANDRERGKEVEQEVLERRRRAASCNDSSFLRAMQLNWRLVHNGIQPQPEGSAPYFEIEHLRVNGVPLRVSPDLVYHNVELSKVVIVEIKNSRMIVPSNLWPNVWAQLWCYSQIDIALNANTVSVVGEVWGDRWSRSYGTRRRRVAGQRIISLRASVQRDPRAASYDQFFRQLFAVYSNT
ncbi:hypothetical protein [Mesorhizobium sp.]|uniref:hypothetical protein n=1 Tax=Mesorhizobium sp. TaxID=1871066 RepID=UPI000FE6C55C|nr:hypothetical protein [Mesorhizobium sp.]RWP08950.1 MAG: hypothetical protein EOQ99_01295 [Mesorhizobium sp.]